MSHGRRPRQRAAVQDTVTRYGWPVVLAMLVAAVAALAVAWSQSQRLVGEYAERDRTTAKTTASFLEGYVADRLAEQAELLTLERSAFDDGARARLDELVRDDVLRLAPSYVRGIIVTDADGRVVVSRARTDAVLTDPQVVREVTTLGRGAAGGGEPVISGVLETSEGRAYAHASPLSGISDAYGAWIVIYDVDRSPAGSFFGRQLKGRDATPRVLDDRGRAIMGRTVGRGDAADGQTLVTVPGTSWTIAVPRTTPPAGVPGWIVLLLALGMVLLGLIYWLQDASRRALADEADQQTMQVERLYRLAEDMLHAPDLDAQAAFLATAVHDAAGVDAVEVRIADIEQRDPAVAGSIPARRARRYVLAITGPRAAIGEVVLWRRDDPVSEESRHVARTMAAIAGAAMHTLVVLGRERETAEELQRVDELRTNLMSTVAHELRSPLTAVKGVLGLLSMQDDLPAKSHEYVRLAEQRTDALVALIRDLFDTSLLESGQLDIRPQRCVASELLEQSLGALATSRPGEVVLSATPNLKVTVDPLRFDQIANNLVTNAFRHGAPPVEVELRPYRDGAVLFVSDHGPGIAPEERERIFSKFYQTDSGNARLVEGAGLGLALVQGLVVLHGGRIEVDAMRPDGRGARFRIYLPDVVRDDAPRRLGPETIITDGGARPQPAQRAAQLLVPPAPIDQRSEGDLAAG